MKEMKDKWIFCKDKLPECKNDMGDYRRSDIVVVGTIDSSGYKNIGLGRFCIENDGETSWDIESWYALEDEKVIAWQPLSKLPDPPLSEET